MAKNHEEKKVYPISEIEKLTGLTKAVINRLKIEK